MRFVIDESTFRLDGSHLASSIEALEVLLDLLDGVREQGHGACLSEELFAAEVLGTKTLFELFDVSIDPHIPKNVQERIIANFGLLPRWEELDFPIPDCLDVTIGAGISGRASSVAWAHTQKYMEGGAGDVSCVVLTSADYSDGSADVVVQGLSLSIWFTSELATLKNFFRSMIRADPADHLRLARFAEFAFPQLEFVDGCFRGIRSMNGSYESLLPVIVDHLTALSDHGKRIFSGSWQRAPAEFGGCGVEVSDENGKTKQNQKARTARTLLVNGKNIIFWWHSKLAPHQNRIHFYPDPIARGEKIVVGIFCDHLVT